MRGLYKPSTHPCPCLINNHPACFAQELGRALHMAFFVWRPNALLTHDCDSDIEQQCIAKRPNMAKTPGAVGSCLADIVSGFLGHVCCVLAWQAEHGGCC